MKLGDGTQFHVYLEVLKVPTDVFPWLIVHLNGGIVLVSSVDNLGKIRGPYHDS